MERRPPPPQPVAQDNSSYDSLEPATTTTSSTTTATTITTTTCELTQSTSADNIPNSVVSSKPARPRSPGSLPKRRDTTATPQPDDLGGRQPYAIPPRRIAPRPPPQSKKPFLKSSTVDPLPNNDKSNFKSRTIYAKFYSADAASPSAEKSPPVLRRSPPPAPTTESPKALPENQPDEKKQPDNKEVPDNRTVDHMRPRAVTAAVTRSPYTNKTSPNSIKQSEKRRNLSDSVMSKCV